MQSVVFSALSSATPVYELSPARWPQRSRTWLCPILSAQNRPSINTRSMNEGTTWDKGQRMGGFCIRAEELCPIQCCDTGAALCDSEVPITLLEEWKWQWGPAHQTREGRPERTRRPNSSPHPKGPTTRRFYEHATGCEASLPRQGQALQAVPTQCHSPDSGIL